MMWTNFSEIWLELFLWSSCCGAMVNESLTGLISGLTQWIQDPALPWAVVRSQCGSDAALLWLWFRPAVVAPIRPLAWEPPYVAGAALEKKKTKKKNFFS